MKIPKTYSDHVPLPAQLLIGAVIYTSSAPSIRSALQSTNAIRRKTFVPAPRFLSDCRQQQWITGEPGEGDTSYWDWIEGLDDLNVSATLEGDAQEKADTNRKGLITEGLIGALEVSLVMFRALAGC